MGEVRKLIEDPSFPNGWPVKETHIDHQVKWKDGASKEYGVHGSAVGVDFDICIADGICITVCPVNVFDRMELPGGNCPENRKRWTRASPMIAERPHWLHGRRTRLGRTTASSAEPARSSAPCKP